MNLLKFCLCSDPDYCLRHTPSGLRERAIAYRRAHGAPLPADASRRPAGGPFLARVTAVEDDGVVLKVEGVSVPVGTVVPVGAAWAADSMEGLMSGVAALLAAGRIVFGHHPRSALRDSCWSVEATRWPDDQPGVQRWEGFGSSLAAALAKLLESAP